MASCSTEPDAPSSEDVQNGCHESTDHVFKDVVHENCSTENDCSQPVVRQRRKGTWSRSISGSSDEACFDMELDKENTETERKTSNPSETIPEDKQNQDEKPAAEEETKTRKHHRFAHQNSWKHALKKAMSMPDPWEKFHLDEYSQETAIRHRYNALKKTWSQDKVTIKMDSSPFDQGAMRLCFRLKKLSNFSKHMNWKHAANYVSKHYIEETAKEQYFEDVKLQMDAKLWGEEYNRRNPPKKVDIFQTYIIELHERDGSPLYHLEHFIEGVYKKYNSNSGFVLRDETLRSTPQAFSHFSFERSGHQLIIVDIQGVGDLYTDPQIHTVNGKDYGEANLGTAGMALFFSTHKCNSICQTLGLSEFDISDQEAYRIDKALQTIDFSETVVRSSFEEQFSPRKMSVIYDLYSHCLAKSPPSITAGDFSIPESPPPSPAGDSVPITPGSPRLSASADGWNDSDSSGTESDNSDIFTEHSEDEEEDRRRFSESLVHKSSSVCVEADMMEKLEKLRELQEQKRLRQKSVSTLGQVHFEMAKYNQFGRFTDKEPDVESALYHLHKAAACNVNEALDAMSHIYLHIPQETFPDVTVEETEENTNKGVIYMLQAARAGGRDAMVYMAKAYDTGIGLGTKMNRSWLDAVKWYQNAIDVIEEDDEPENSLLVEPTYKLLARQAEIYLLGGLGLEKDPSYSGELYTKAADEAMQAMNGKLANKFYMKAEEAWAEIEDDE